MLALTDQAASAIKDILEEEDLPDSAGLRISAGGSQNSGGPGTNLQMALVEGPAQDDEILDAAPVYLEPQAAEMLGDKILDANVSGEQVQFTLQGGGQEG